MEQTDELIRVISEARNGYWIPAAVVGSMFTVILFLVIYIFKGVIKKNDERHVENEKRLEKTDELLDTAIENQTTLQIIVGKLEERTKHL